MTRDANAMSFDWRDGVHLVGSDLWFDTARAPGITFVSHAGVRASGRRLLMSPATAKVLRALGRRGRPLAPPLHRPLSIGEHRVEMLSGDLVPGAALLRVENRDGVAIYAGALGEAAEVRSCDRLCLLAPDDADGVAIESLLDGIDDGSGTGIVVLAPGLPEAFAGARTLVDAGTRVRAQPSLRTALRALGISLPPSTEPPALGEALLWPGGGVLADASKAPPARTLRLRPLLPAIATMASYARATGATDIVISGRRATDVAHRLQREGVPARPLSAPDQLGLFHEAAAPGGP